VPEFIGENIEVDTVPSSPRPRSFRWRGEIHIVAEVIDERVDTGYGSLPVHSRTWYNRRHRRYFDVKDTNGEIFEMYMDYAHRRHPSWWLVKKLKPQ
jgi:hypothetical protein